MFKPGRLSNFFDANRATSDLRLLTASEETDTSAKQRLGQKDDVHKNNYWMVFFSPWQIVIFNTYVSL